MSGSSDQLAEVYKQVESYFQGHPVITVKPTKGDPPDQYTITYTMVGLQQGSDGSVIESNKHVVELSIPFGFPHFPPSCKPKSNIFHPDFDPAAICLGDVWEQDSSLANIILYIGKMINGEVFSTKNAFNDEAASWYKENGSKFPLNTISWGGELATPSSSSKNTIDTLDEEDLSDNFDYLTLDHDEDNNVPQPPSFPSVAADEKEDSDLLEQLKFQKRFYELSRKLRTNTNDQLTELKQLADQEVRKCKTLYREAKNLENLGSAAKALKRFEVVQSTVTDYPSIAADINRVEQTLELLSDLDPNQFDGPHPIPETDQSNAKKDQAKQNDKKKEHLPKPRKPRDSFFVDSEKRGKFLTVAMVGLGVVAAGTIGLYYSYTGSILTQSQQQYAQCENSLKALQFKQAKQTCENSKTLLDKIYVFHQADSNSLRNKIDTILLSEALRNGLEGKVLFDGMYLSKKQVTEFEKIKTIATHADALFKAGKWKKASEQYTLLLENRAAIKTFSPELLNNAEEKKYLCQFQISIESAEKFITEEQWHLAIGSLTHTQSLLSGLANDQRAIYKEKLQDSLNRCKFEIALKNGESAFNRGNWQDAIISYESCLNIALTYNAIKPAQIRTISNIIDRSKIYMILEQGNSAFTKGKWNEAIEAYTEASAALASNQTLLNEAKIDINRKKLGKIILQASIIRDKQTVKSQLQNEELNEAGKLYNQILETIEGSTYSSEKEFVKAREEINSTLEDLNQKIYISEKESYLRENYQSLFVANYPAAVRENLKQPVISFVKDDSGILLFRMQCTEKRRGSRPLNLVMFYAYNKANNQWELSTENKSKSQ